VRGSKSVAGKRQARAGRPAAVRLLPRARVAAAVSRLTTTVGAERFAAAKALLVTAEKDPARLYPHFAAIVDLLAGTGKVLRWNALQMLSLLAAVDTERRLDGVLPQYLAFIAGPSLISAANAIQGAGRIAQARPDLRARIVAALLAVEHATYETAECRNVALGHVLDVLATLGDEALQDDSVRAFVLRQRTNSRAAVARRAQSMAV
jgi:hypothetical protein